MVWSMLHWNSINYRTICTRCSWFSKPKCLVYCMWIVNRHSDACVYSMVREKNGMYNTGTTKLCLVTVEEVEKMDTMHSRMTMEKQRIKKTITTATTTKMMVMMTLATTTNKQTCLTIENTKKINLMYGFCVGGEHWTWMGLAMSRISDVCLTFWWNVCPEHFSRNQILNE